MALTVANPTAGTLVIIGAVVIGTIIDGAFVQYDGTGGPSIADTTNLLKGTGDGNAADSGVPLSGTHIAGVANGGSAGGTVNLDGGSGASSSAGDINTSGGGTDFAAGGSINTSGGATGGGGIDTSNGGGGIYTRETGIIELGADGTRTTLTGAASANRAIALPDASGTVALQNAISGTFTVITSITINNGSVTAITGT